MKPRTLSRGMNRLRKCVALLVTCSLLLMIFAPASQAYRNPSPADPVPMSFEKDDDPWGEADIVVSPQYKAGIQQSGMSLNENLFIKLLQVLGIINVNTTHTQSSKNKQFEVSSHAKNDNVATELNRIVDKR